VPQALNESTEDAGASQQWLETKGLLTKVTIQP